MTEPTFTVTEAPDHRRFELYRDGQLVGYAAYYREGNTVTVPHVETLPEFRNNGYGARLVDGIMELVREHDERIVPLCWFAADHIRANPRYHDLLA